MTQPSILEFGRSSTITVASVQIQNIGQKTGLHAWFQARRSIKPNEPNTCDLRLWNLAPASRKAIESAAAPIGGPATGPGAQPKAVPVKIEAGYVGAGGTSTIFLGEMRSAQTIRDHGTDDITELTTGDGDQAVILARSTAAFGKGANALTVAQQLLADMKLGQGNLGTVAAILQAQPLYGGGVVLKGSSWEHLQDLCTSCGLEVSCQGGVAQFTSLGQPLPGQAYRLSSDTGLLGSPSVDTKGVLSCETQMLPGLRPGASIVMDAKYVKGTYRIISIETTGDTWGDDWRHQIEAKRVGLAP